MLLFRVLNVYKQGKDLKEDPVKFGVDLGREAIAPLFIVPTLGLAVLSLGTLALWWRVGWGIFLFLAIIFAIGIVFVHGMYIVISKATRNVEGTVHQQYDSVASTFQSKSSSHNRERHIVDTDAQEK